MSTADSTFGGAVTGGAVVVGATVVVGIGMVVGGAIVVGGVVVVTTVDEGFVPAVKGGIVVDGVVVFPCHAIAPRLIVDVGFSPRSCAMYESEPESNFPEPIAELPVAKLKLNFAASTNRGLMPPSSPYPFGSSLNPLEVAGSAFAEAMELNVFETEEPLQPTATAGCGLDALDR